MEDDRFFEDDIVSEHAVAQWLKELGFLPALVTTVLEHSKVRLIQGKWFRWPGNIPDRARLILRSKGSPIETEQLALEIGEVLSKASVRNALQADSRFVRVSKKAFGLREWGLEEYSGIVEEMAERIERAGGSIDLDSVVEELVSTFGVSANSVRMYGSLAPRFVLSDGILRLRRPDERVVEDTRIHAVAGLFPDLVHKQVHLVIQVDENVERGSGMAVHPAVGHALGVVPGQRKSFRNGVGSSLAVSWPDSSPVGPSIGSTRALAEAANATIGEAILTTFCLSDNSVKARKIPPGTKDITLLTGLQSPIGRELETIAHSIGCSPIEVRSVLLSRGDQSVLDALPVSKDLRLEAAISSLSKLIRD